MTPQPNNPAQMCSICGERPAQSIIAGKDGTTTIRIPTCGECFIAAEHPELRLFRSSLHVVIGGWPR